MLKIILNRVISFNGLFFCLLILVYFFYNFQEIFFLRPQGVHFARQTDSLAFVTGYYKYGMSFFEPKGLNLFSEEGRGASEFPILYYLTACFYYVFGEHEFILRLLNVSIVSCGFYYLFKLIRNLFQDVFYAFVLTFLFLSSTVLIYYTNNFLPDVSAFSFVLIGWYFFYNYLSERKKKSLVLCFLFFTISALFKITFFINPVAAFITLIYFLSKDKSEDFKLLIKVFLISLIVNIAWVLYIVYYNHIFGNNYFTTAARPIWQLSNDSIETVWSHIYNFWYTKYYFQSTFHLMYIILFSGLLLITRITLKLLIPAILLIIGSLCYITLFYQMFQDHDYYFITLLPTLIIAFLASFYAIQSKFPKLIGNYLVKLIFLVICVLSINYSRKKLSTRYLDSKNDIASITNKFYGVNKYMTKLGVNDFSKFIVVEEPSRNGSLYFLNRQGWIFNDFSKLNDTVISKLIISGAEYLIVVAESNKTVHSDLLTKIGEVNGMFIYKLVSQ